MLRVHLLGLLHHPQRLVLAARRHAGRASLAQVRNEDREDAARAGAPFLRRREDRIRLLISHRHLVDDVEELALGLGREAVDLVGHLLDDLRKRQRVLRQALAHHAARAFFDLRHEPEHLLTLDRIRHVVDDRRSEHGLQVLRAVGQRRVRTDRDALHALRAVLGDIERRLPARHIFRRRVAAARGHDAERGIGVRGLVVPVARPEHLVELLDPRQRRAFALAFGNLMRTASRPAPVPVAVPGEDRQERLATHAGSIGRGELADWDLAHAIEPLRHDLHVGLHDALAQSSELLHVLVVHDLVELLLRDTKLLEQRRDGEKRAEKGVALHAQLEVASIGGLPGNLEPWQREDPDLLLDDLLPGPHREPLPRLLAFFVGLPHETAALRHAVERVGVRERLGVAAQDDGDVTQVAVHPDPIRCRDHEVGGRRALLLRSVFGIRADVNDFLRISKFVDDLVPVVQQIVQVADDRAEVLAGRDRTPAADGMETDGNRPFRQERRRLVRLHFVGVIDAKNEERDAVSRAFPVLARPFADRELVRAEGMLGPEVARAEPVDPGEETRHLVRGHPREPLLVLQRLVQRRPDVASHRVVAGQRLVGPLEDDDVLLPRQRFDDGRLRERAEHVGVDRAHLHAPLLAHVVDRGFDVFRRRSQRHEHRVGIVGLVLAHQTVVAARELAELPVRVLEELQDRLDKVVPPGDDALHVVLLVLDRAKEHGVRQVDHFRHAAAFRTEEHALTLRRAVDDVVGRAQVPADEL